MSLLLAAGLFVGTLSFGDAMGAAESHVATTDAEAPAGRLILRVVPAPDGGYWLVFDDETVEAIGGAPHPEGADPTETVPPDDRAIGLLAGVVSRQYLAGSAVDPRLECVGDMTVQNRVGQVLMPGVDWHNIGGLSEAVEAGLIGGFVVLGSPGADIAESITDLRSVAPMGLLVAVDEEGGRVQRLREAVGRLPSASVQADQNSPDELRALLASHAAAVRGLGFDMALAPVLDVGGGPGIGDRAYGAAASDVTEYGLAVAFGLQDGGLLPVVKHFPGHGRASVDSHISLPVTPALEEMLVVDIEPFRAAVEAGIGAVMIGHLDVPGLTNGLPASLSMPAITDLLRGELGFDGLVMSDALSMGAIIDRWSTAQAAELALIAGIDVVLLGDASEVDVIHREIGNAIVDGRLSDRRLTQAAASMMAAKSIDPCAAIAG